LETQPEIDLIGGETAQ